MIGSRKAALILCFFFLALAAACILYPWMKTTGQETMQRAELEEFERYITAAQTAPQNPEAEGAGGEQPTAQPFQELLEAARAYNDGLSVKQQPTGEALKQAPLELAEYGYDSEIFARLRVPDGGIDMPVYLGASAANLDAGAAVLGQTSLPIGGQGTKCVIAGHRSWKGALLFRPLEDLDKGSLVEITNPWETLTYRVCAVEVVDPDNLDILRIEPGADLLLLLTCTRDGKNRIIVTCERMDKQC